MHKKAKAKKNGRMNTWAIMYKVEACRERRKLEKKQKPATKRQCLTGYWLILKTLHILKFQYRKNIIVKKSFIKNILAETS